METALNSGLSFIKHVDCGRGVSKEAHKVLIEKTKKIVDFYCWLILVSLSDSLLHSAQREVKNISTTLKVCEFLKIAKILSFESPAKIRNH